MLFASATPVPREALQKVVGQAASVDLLIEDLRAELADRAFEIANVAEGWMMRTKTQFAEAIRAAADLGDQDMEFTGYEMAVLATIAYHQPISRAQLKEVFGKDINRDLIGRLYAKELIATGPRSPKRGAPHGLEVEAVETFGGGELRSLDPPFHHTPFPVDELQFGEAQKVAGMIDTFCRALFGNFVRYCQVVGWVW